MRVKTMADQAEELLIEIRKAAQSEDAHPKMKNALLMMEGVWTILAESEFLTETEGSS